MFVMVVDPGIVCAITKKSRFSTGKSSICSSFTTDDGSDLVTSISAPASPVTVTFCATSVTPTLKFTVSSDPTSSVTVFFCVANPCASTVIVYCAGCRLTARYNPSDSVVNTCDSWLLLLVTVTFAPGMAASEGSVTTPFRFPPTCPQVGTALSDARNITPKIASSHLHPKTLLIANLMSNPLRSLRRFSHPVTPRALLQVAETSAFHLFLHVGPYLPKDTELRGFPRGFVSAALILLHHSREVLGKVF